VLDLVRMLVALEMLLLPPWAGAVVARPRPDLRSRLVRPSIAVVAAGAAMLVLSAFAGAGVVVGVLRSQAVALGFVVLLAGVGVLAGRWVGPRAVQMVVTLSGWFLLASVILLGPVVGLLDEPFRTAVARFAIHANPLVAAEFSLDLVWFRQNLTYRLSPFGESYAYLVPDPAWYKTLLGHVFAGSGLLVFGMKRPKAAAPTEPG
jgi:hypothetical protein